MLKMEPSCVNMCYHRGKGGGAERGNGESGAEDKKSPTTPMLERSHRAQGRRRERVCEPGG